MCGIAGHIQALPSPPDRHLVQRMAETLRHRGPDGAGEFAADHLVMRNCRLGIIDLAGGSQPLFNEDRSLVLIANAEIYNFVELGKELRSRGHRFATGSDCEVILHLYEEKGLDAVRQLRGMFAFALWDAHRRRLVLARDRLGEKPLFLHESGSSLLFASELKAVLRSGRVAFDLDPDSVDRYFHYEWVPDPATPLKGVRKLPPATLLTVDVDPWRLNEVSYWCMEDAPAINGQPAEVIREELERVAALTLRADVPVGIGLSGGLDSGAIAALAARHSRDQLHAFCIGYPGRPACDERTHAKRLAESLGINYYEREVAAEEIVEVFPDVVYWWDEPIADISGPAYYLLMQFARQNGVPVMLLGHGGDELFWGYRWLARAARETARKERLLSSGLDSWPLYFSPRWPADWTRGGLRAWLLSIGGLRDGLRSMSRDWISPREQAVFYDLADHYQTAAASSRWLHPPQFSAALGKDNAARIFQVPRPWPAPDILVPKLIAGTYLLNNGIAQGDRLGMASSVELRLPFVDFRLWETVVGLRKGGNSDVALPPKSWLRAAMKDLLPAEVIGRPKRGFTAPLSTWTSLVEAYGSNLHDGYLVQHGILQAEGARRLIADRSLIRLCFRALVLELWCRQYQRLAGWRGG